MGMTPYYDRDGITIFHGDCREVTAWLDADVMVTDPPYGLNAQLNSGGRHGYVVAKDKRVVPDWDTDLEARDEALSRWGDKPALVFASVTMPPPVGAYPRPLVWDKGEAVGMGDVRFPWRPNYELVWAFGGGFSGRRTTSILRFPTPPRGRLHPTEKPVDLLRELIGKCPPGVVADPFMGSGTTLRAAKDVGRRAIGVELDERYCEIAARRLSQQVLDLGGVS